MAIPTLQPPEPATGPTSGGDLVTLRGSGFGSRLAVRFGSADATVVATRVEALQSIAIVRTPPHAEAAVDILLQNLDAAEQPIPGEQVLFSAAYRFLRPRIVRNAAQAEKLRALLEADGYKFEPKPYTLYYAVKDKLAVKLCELVHTQLAE